MPKGAAQAVLDEATVVLPLAGLIDLAAERARLAQGTRQGRGEARKIAQKLGNADFVRRAPEEVVEENRDRLAAPKPRSRGWKRRCADRMRNLVPLSLAR